MAKLFTYIFIIVGLMVLFNAAGLQTAGSVVVDQLGLAEGDIAGFRTTAFWITFAVSALAALVTAGIVMGTIGRGNPEIFVTALYAVPLLAFVGEMISITVQASSESTFAGTVIFLIMSPLIVLYTIALYDWVRGKD